MSSRTDKAFASGLLEVLGGVRSDMIEEKRRKSELKRQEGIMRLRAGLEREYSPSGYVDKKTGRAILQNELENYDEGSLMTSADFQILMGDKEADAAWNRGQRARDYEKGLLTEEREHREGIRQEDLKREDQHRKEDKQHDLNLFSQKEASLDRRAKERMAAEYAHKEKLAEIKNRSKGKLSDDDRIELIKVARQEYKELGVGEDKEEGGFLGFGKETIEGQSFQDWYSQEYPEEFALVYGQQASSPSVAKETETPKKTEKPTKPQGSKEEARSSIDKYLAKSGKANAPKMSPEAAKVLKNMKGGGLLDDVGEEPLTPKQNNKRAKVQTSAAQEMAKEGYKKAGTAAKWAYDNVFGGNIAKAGEEKIKQAIAVLKEDFQNTKREVRESDIKQIKREVLAALPPNAKKEFLAKSEEEQNNIILEIIESGS